MGQGCRSDLFFSTPSIIQECSLNKASIYNSARICAVSVGESNRSCTGLVHRRRGTSRRSVEDLGTACLSAHSWDVLESLHCQVSRNVSKI